MNVKFAFVSASVFVAALLFVCFLMEWRTPFGAALWPLIAAYLFHSETY